MLKRAISSRTPRPSQSMENLKGIQNQYLLSPYGAELDL